MRPFCPDGYVRAQEAMLGAALCWFPEQISAFEMAAADELASAQGDKDEFERLTPVEKLARVLEGAPSLSAGVLQEGVDLLSNTEHRLRNFLHRGLLTAFYFGGLVDQGRHEVARDFWATTEADGVLMSGYYWPFGKAQRWYEQRPSYTLCFLESELAKVLSENPKSQPGRSQTHRPRGRKPIKLEQVKEAMRRDFSQLTELQGMLEKELADKYRVSRDTARKARDAIVSEMTEKSILDK